MTIDVKAALGLEFTEFSSVRYDGPNRANRNSNIWYTTEEELRNYIKKHVTVEKTLRCNFE